jgi:hypothetical protein
VVLFSFVLHLNGASPNPKTSGLLGHSVAKMR